MARQDRKRAAGSGRTVFVDTGAWLALVHPRDNHHAEADGLFRRAAHEKRRLVTTSLVLAELHRLVLFGAGIAAASAVLERLDRSPLLTVDFPTQAHHMRARVWIERLSDQKLTYTDATSFATMEVRRLNIALTFDRHFEIAGFARWRAEAS